MFSKKNALSGKSKDFMLHVQNYNLSKVSYIHLQTVSDIFLNVSFQFILYTLVPVERISTDVARQTISVRQLSFLFNQLVGYSLVFR